MRSTWKTFHGYRNVAFHAGPSPDGTVVLFRSKALRDKALAELRARAIAEGLAASAAKAGIYPITQTLHTGRDFDTIADIAHDGSAGGRS